MHTDAGSAAAAPASQAPQDSQSSGPQPQWGRGLQGERGWGSRLAWGTLSAQLHLGPKLLYDHDLSKLIFSPVKQEKSLPSKVFRV